MNNRSREHWRWMGLFLKKKEMKREEKKGTHRETTNVLFSCVRVQKKRKEKKRAIWLSGSIQTRREKQIVCACVCVCYLRKTEQEEKERKMKPRAPNVRTRSRMTRTKRRERGFLGGFLKSWQEVDDTRKQKSGTDTRANIKKKVSFILFFLTIFCFFLFCFVLLGSFQNKIFYVYPEEKRQIKRQKLQINKQRKTNNSKKKEREREKEKRKQINVC